MKNGFGSAKEFFGLPKDEIFCIAYDVQQVVSNAPKVNKAKLVPRMHLIIKRRRLMENTSGNIRWPQFVMDCLPMEVCIRLAPLS
jgi:hypothetical protein